MLIAPEAFDVRRHPDRNRERVERMERLLRGEYRPQGLFDVYDGAVTGDRAGELPGKSFLESAARAPRGDPSAGLR